MHTGHIRQKWQRWLKKDLFPEILYLMKLKIAYKKFEDIFTGSQKYSEKSHFYWYLGQVHGASTVAGIYRLIDNRCDVVSLLNLLNAVKRNPVVISRRAYTRIAKGLYRDKDDYRIIKHALNNEFTKMAGHGPHIGSSIVTRDITQIERVSRKVAKFRHKFIAHHAHNQSRYSDKPTFKQVHNCIDILAEIVHRYYQLITACHIQAIDDWIKQDIEKDIAKICCRRLRGSASNVRK